jgi:methyl-accepting chemotaxis protein
MIFFEFWNNLKVRNKIIFCYALPVALIIFFAIQIQTLSNNVSQASESIAQELKSSGQNDIADKVVPQIEQINGSVNKLGYAALALSFFFIAGAFVGGLLLVRSVSMPVYESMCMANKIAGGDLDVWIKKASKDECGQLQEAMKNMADNLKNIVTQITVLSGTVASSSKNVWATTNGINKSIDEQAMQIQQSFEATSRVSQTIMNVAKNAVDASDATGESVKVATEGKSVVEQTVSSMLNIAGNVDKSSKTVEHLGESSKKIGDIIDVINDIAGQTNLLALNAAIEAARAGEQGRGFAVVADEVRKLAEKTSKATDEITDMIKMIQQDTRESIQSMMKNKEEAEEGVSHGEQAKTSLDRIVSASDRCKDQVQSITASTEEQSSAIEEVSSISENLTNTFEGSRQAITNIISSTDELAKVSTELQKMVSWFNTGSDSPAHAQRAKARNMQEKASVAGA